MIPFISVLNMAATCSITLQVVERVSVIIYVKFHVTTFASVLDPYIQDVVV